MLGLWRQARQSEKHPARRCYCRIRSSTTQVKLDPQYPEFVLQGPEEQAGWPGGHAARGYAHHVRRPRAEEQLPAVGQHRVEGVHRVHFEAAIDPSEAVTIRCRLWNGGTLQMRTYPCATVGCASFSPSPGGLSVTSLSALRAPSAVISFFATLGCASLTQCPRVPSVAPLGVYCMHYTLASHQCQHLTPPCGSCEIRITLRHIPCVYYKLRAFDC